MIKTLQWHEICSEATAHIGKPSVYVSNGLEYEDPKDEEIWLFVQNEMKKLYGDNTQDFYSVMSLLVAGGLFFFETEQEQYQFYRVFEQPLTDSSAVYASTYGADGQAMTENT